MFRHFVLILSLYYFVSHSFLHTSGTIGAYAISVAKLLLCRNVDISRHRLLDERGSEWKRGGRGIAALKGHNAINHLLCQASRATAIWTLLEYHSFVSASCSVSHYVVSIYLSVLAIYRLNVALFSRWAPTFPSPLSSAASGRAHALLFRGREVLPSKSSSSSSTALLLMFIISERKIGTFLSWFSPTFEAY